MDPFQMKISGFSEKKYNKNVFTGGCCLPDPLLFPGGFQPPRPPALQLPVSPCSIFERLHLSSSPAQDPGNKILVPRSWYQDLDTKILVPRSLGNRFWVTGEPPSQQTLTDIFLYCKNPTGKPGWGKRCFEFKLKLGNQNLSINGPEA